MINTLLIYNIFFILIAVLSIILGSFVLLKNTKHPVNVSWFFVTLNIALWSFGWYKVLNATSSTSALLWSRIFHTGIILLPLCLYYFVFAWLKLPKNIKISGVIHIFCLFFISVNYNVLFVKSAEPRYDLTYCPVISIFYPFYTAYFIGAVIYLHLVIFRVLHRSSGIFKNQIKYFLVASIIGFGGGATAFFPLYRVPIPMLGIPLVVFYPIIISLAMVKHRLMDIKVAVTRTGIFLVVYTFVLGIPFWFGFKTSLLVWSLVLMAILATAGPFIYRRLQQKAEAILLAQQKHYQRLLLQAATGMVREHNLDKLLNLIVRVVKNAVKIEFAAVFLKDKKDNSYTLKAIRDHKSFPEALTFSYDHSIIKLIKERRTPLSYEDISHLSEGGLYKPIHLIVPCFIDDNLLGFLALGEKKDRTFYTQDDINVFEILSRQTALAVEYCMFLEEFKKGQEKIFTAEKLASIGGMAGGMAHQIRNRLGVFRACAETLEFTVEEYITKHSKVMEEDIELKGILGDVVKGFNTIVSNVERTAKIVNGIIDFARTQETDIEFSEFVLMEIIDLCIPILKAKHSLGEELPFSLKIEVGSKDTIYGSKGQLTEGMFNFLDNGYEALLEIGLYLSEEEKKDYRPEIKIRLTQTKDSYLIEVSDNGIGIKEEDKLKIFSPYFTTKASSISGTGIGMYVIKRIIEENHKGKVWFESTYKKGTKFYIELPKKGSRKE